MAVDLEELRALGVIRDPEPNQLPTPAHPRECDPGACPECRAEQGPPVTPAAVLSKARPPKRRFVLGFALGYLLGAGVGVLAFKAYFRPAAPPCRHEVVHVPFPVPAADWRPGMEITRCDSFGATAVVPYRLGPGGLVKYVPVTFDARMCPEVLGERWPRGLP